MTQGAVPNMATRGFSRAPRLVFSLVDGVGGGRWWSPTGSCELRALVSLHVQRQVVRAGETAAAHGALERLGARVFPEMASQLVGSGEAPLASLPGADVRLLSFSGKKDGDRTTGRIRLQQVHG